MGFDLGGMFGQLTGGGGSTGTSTPGGSYWNASPQYGGVRDTMTGVWSQYLPKQLENLQAGRPTQWAQNANALQEYQMKNKLRGQYYGKAAGPEGGNMYGPGMFDQQMGTDIRAGRRGAGAGSNQARQMEAYTTGMSDIDRYIAQLGYQSMGESEGRYLTTLAGLPRGPQGEWANYAPVEAGGETGGMLGNMDFSKVLSQVGGLFGGNQSGTVFKSGATYGNANPSTITNPWASTTQSNVTNQLSYNNTTGQNYGGYSW